MARLPRYRIKNQPQIIMQRGIDQQDVFFHEDDYQNYLECLEVAARNYRLKIHAYVLMPGEVQLLASPGAELGISRTLQSLGRNYAQYLNDNYWRGGALWEGRYRATILDSKAYLLSCSRYIERNPVRSGLVKHPREYAWSSYAHNAMGRQDSLISEHKIYQTLGATERERSKAYRSLFRKKMSLDEETLIYESTLKGWALGDKRFVARIEKMGERRATPLPRGRPRLSGS
ncbi:MAG: transposase [Gammaproteobacteria bacterium]